MTWRHRHARVPFPSATLRSLLRHRSRIGRTASTTAAQSGRLCFPASACRCRWPRGAGHVTCRPHRSFVGGNIAKCQAGCASPPLVAAPTRAGRAQTKLQTPRRIFDGEQCVTAGSYFRVHLHPKRFPRARRVRWRERILFDAPGCVVVDKPWGVQVTHRVDNVRESLVGCLTQVRAAPALAANLNDHLTSPSNLLAAAASQT